MEDLRYRYQNFLHFVLEGSGRTDQGSEEVQQTVDAQEQTEDATNREIEDNLRHEVEELKVESIEAAYFDHNFWKPQVDYNLDDLLSEMNKSQSL